MSICPLYASQGGRWSFDRFADLLAVQGDFMKLPFPDNHFDGVYAIEATCHAPDRTKVRQGYYERTRGGAGREVCLTVS